MTEELLLAYRSLQQKEKALGGQRARGRRWSRAFSVLGCGQLPWCLQVDRVTAGALLLTNSRMLGRDANLR